MTLISRRVDDLDAQPSATVCPPTEDQIAAVLHDLLRATAGAVPGVRHAALSVLDRHSLPRVLVSTGDLSRRLESLQFALDEGPTLDAIRGADPVVVVRHDDLGRWQHFGPRACVLGMTSAVAARLRWNDRTMGALSVYFLGHEPVPEAAVQLVSALATHAAATLTFARKAEQLEFAMLTRQQIGQAVGVLMERCGLSPEAAFSYLRRVSQTRNVKLREVAQGLVTTGELPLSGARGQGGSVNTNRGA